MYAIRCFALYAAAFYGLTLSGCAMSQMTEAKLTIVDEQGAPVSFPTIWGYLQPGQKELDLNGEDVWRIANRFRDSFEFATPFSPILPAQWIPAMGNSDGKANIEIDYQDRYGTDQKSPNTLHSGFVIMKSGFFPSRVDFLTRLGSTNESRIVMRRDHAYKTQNKEIAEAFDRWRYELSDTSKFARVDEGTKVQIERITEALNQLAQKAVSNKDFALAARIYARMQLIPSVRISDGAMVGFTQFDPYSTGHFHYLEQAYELDPHNSYIASEYLYRFGSVTFGGNKYKPSMASTTEREQFSLFFENMNKLMSEKGESVWPAYHHLYALWHLKLDRNDAKTTAENKLVEFYEWEPKYMKLEEMKRLVK